MAARLLLSNLMHGFELVEPACADEFGDMPPVQDDEQSTADEEERMYNQILTNLKMLKDDAH
jgi:hypothetical protein